MEQGPLSSPYKNNIFTLKTKKAFVKYLQEIWVIAGNVNAKLSKNVAPDITVYYSHFAGQ